MRSRTIGLWAPFLGLAVSVGALCLWVSNLKWSGLDVLAGSLLVAMLVLSIVSYTIGSNLAVRRSSVVALGMSGFGLLTMALVRSLRQP